MSGLRPSAPPTSPTKPSPRTSNGERDREAVPTAAATEARRRQARAKLAQVEKAIGQLRRERGQLTVRGIADRAGVSPTFCYENPDACTLVQGAIADAGRRRTNAVDQEHDRIEASWRERALNTEEALTRTQQIVFDQRHRIGDLMGLLRDTEQARPGESVDAIILENAQLKRRVEQLAREGRSLQERLEGARSNLRFAEKRNADLEVQLLEW